MISTASLPYRELNCGVRSESTEINKAECLGPLVLPQVSEELIALFATPHSPMHLGYTPKLGHLLSWRHKMRELWSN
jgi:hypothetical protein